MKFENVKVISIGETVNGTSKAGNAYTMKTAVFEITPEGEEYPQSIACKTLSASVIDALEALAVGQRVAAVCIDFNAREYGGKWYTDNKLWAVDAAPAVEAQAPAPTPRAPKVAPQPTAVDTVAQLFDAQPVRPLSANMQQEDDLPF